MWELPLVLCILVVGVMVLVDALVVVLMVQLDVLVVVQQVQAVSMMMMLPRIQVVASMVHFEGVLNLATLVVLS